MLRVTVSLVKGLNGAFMEPELVGNMKASKKSDLLQRLRRIPSFSRDCTFKHSKVHCTGFPLCTGGTPFYVHEVIDQGGEPIKVQEYFGVGRVTEFRYGIKVRGPVFANLLRSPGIDSQTGGIDSWAPLTFTNTGSGCFTLRNLRIF